MKKLFSLFIIIIISSNSISCLEKENKKYLPKGYHRIELDVKNNITKSFSFDDSKFSFKIPDYFETYSNTNENSSKNYLEITLYNKKHNLSFILNYREIQNNLSKLIEEAYNPQIFNTADGIIETKDEEGKILIYELKGNVANPYLFHITDKHKHFLHGMMFVCSDPKKKCQINIDSLQPIIKYFEKDMYNLINSLKWSQKETNDVQF